MNILIIILRIFLTFVLAYLFGLDRQRAHKAIGFGTYVFVALGSCSLTLLALSLYPENPLPLLSGIVTDIGFLGAGALIKTTDKIFGFTTAASIWVFAIFGIIIGSGQYFEGLVLYLAIWLVVCFDKILEKRGVGSYRKKLMVTILGVDNAKQLETMMPKGIRSYIMIATDLDKKNDRCVFTYLVEGTKDQLNFKIQKLYSHRWCESIKVE